MIVIRLIAIRFVLLILLLVFDETVSQSGAVDFRKALISIANDKLGVQFYQDYVDNELKFKTFPTQGDDVAAQIADALSSRIIDHVNMVKEMRSLIETAFNSGSGNLQVPTCCTLNMSDNTFDARFRNKTNPSSLCSLGLLQNTFYYDVFDQMKRNLVNVPTLRWQYYADETGFMVMYPSAQRCTDSSFDPRLRAWYLESLSTRPKDVVILIQSSSSMSSLAAAKSATTIVINSLTARDRVGVVAFSGEPFMNNGDSCFKSQLSVVNPTTRQSLSQFYNYRQAVGDVNYTRAFIAAFQLLNNSLNAYDSREELSSTRDRVIILLTNGDRIKFDANYSFHAIREGNKPFKNKVKIFAYSFQSNDESNVILEELIQQKYIDEQYGERTPGVFRVRLASTSFRTFMSDYFTSFVTVSQSASATYSIPHSDEFGVGLVMSLCVPVAPAAVVTGVTCADVTIDSLFSEVQYFQQTTSSYAFLIDGYGRLLLHPLIPQSLTVSPDVSLVDLTQIEYDFSDKVSTLRSSMLQRPYGSMQISSRRVHRKGDSVIKGVNTEIANNTYYWHQVGNTNFTVCVVISGAYENRTVMWLEELPPVFLMDEVPLNDSMLSPRRCYFVGRFAIDNITAVKLAPKAFKSPSAFLDVNYNSTVRRQWIDFLEGRLAESSYIKTNIREAVASTFKLQEFWQQRNDYKNLVWRYIGLKEGIFRKYPATAMTPEYDPTRRPWYQQAVADKGNYSIYGPFVDYSQTGCYISVGKAIEYKTSRVTTELYEDSAVIGVMAVDFRVEYLGQLLNKSFPSCQLSSHDCFVIDQSGYTVFHKSFLPAPSDCSGIRNRHLSCMASDVALDMIRRGVLAAGLCISYVNTSGLKFWNVEGQLLSLSNPPYYEVYPIANTNLYVIDQNKNAFLQSTGSCGLCDRNYIDGTLCSKLSGNISSLLTQCEPSCYSVTDYSQLCSGKLNYNSAVPPCITPAIPLMLVDIQTRESPYVAQVCPCQDSMPANCKRTNITSTTESLFTESFSTESSVRSSSNLLPLLVLLVLPVLIVLAVIVRKYCWVQHKQDVPQFQENPVYRKHRPSELETENFYHEIHPNSILPDKTAKPGDQLVRSTNEDSGIEQGASVSESNVDEFNDISVVEEITGQADRSHYLSIQSPASGLSVRLEDNENNSSDFINVSENGLV